MSVPEEKIKKVLKFLNGAGLQLKRKLNLKSSAQLSSGKSNYTTGQASDKPMTREEFDLFTLNRGVWADYDEKK